MENVEKTKQLDLCVSCEICSAICPNNAIRMESKFGQFLPVIDSEKCLNCGLCLKFCPGINLDSLNLRNKKNSSDIFEDSCIESYTAFSKNLNIRKKSASGGLVTTLIIELIKNKEFEKAFVLSTDLSNNKPARIEATNKISKILESAKSKYVPASVYNVIKAFKKNKDLKCIIVGTPCQFYGIKKFLATNKISEKNILFLGLFCDKTLNFNIIKYFKENYAKSNEKIVKFDFRTKDKNGWPGNSKICFDSDRKIIIDRKIRIQLKKFFQLNRCLLCVDKLNRKADISFGDCYLENEDSYYGKSSVIVRTQKGKTIFDRYLYLFTLKKESLKKIEVSQKVLDRIKNLEYAKIFIKKHNIYNNLNYKIDNKIEKKLEQLQKYIKWGKDYNVKKIKLFLFLLKFKKKLKAIKRKNFALPHLILTFYIFIFKSAFLNRKKKETLNKKHPRNIIIVGSNFLNKGAQAMLFVTVNQIKVRFPNKNIYLFSKTKSDEKKKSIYKFDILLWDTKSRINFLRNDRFDQHSEKIKSIILNTDFFVDISGFALSSKFPLFNTIIYLSNIIIAKKYQIPYYIFPQSIGPFNYSLRQKIILYPLLKLCLSYPKKIFIREKDGLKSINKFTKKNVEGSFDIVLQNKKYNLSNIYNEKVHFKKIEIKPNSVAIIPNLKVLERMNPTKFYSVYNYLIEILVKSEKTVYLLRHSYEDLKLCEEIKKQFINNNNVVLMSEDFNVIELEDIIKQFDFIITSRYHSIIHAYKYGIPALVIGWAVKYFELLEKFGQLNYYFNIDNKLSISDVEKSLCKMTRNYQKEKIVIIDKVNSLNVENENSFDSLDQNKY